MRQVSLQCKKVQAALARTELDSPAVQGQRLGRKPMNLTMEETLGVGREPGNSPLWPSGRNLHRAWALCRGASGSSGEMDSKMFILVQKMSEGRA